LKKVNKKRKIKLTKIKGKNDHLNIEQNNKFNDIYQKQRNLVKLFKMQCFYHILFVAGQ